jgi:hypothetical protein
LILTILIDLYMKKINYKPSWLNHFLKKLWTFKNEYNTNVGIVRGLTKRLKNLCTLVWILHVPLFIHCTMLSPKLLISIAKKFTKGFMPSQDIYGSRVHSKHINIFCKGVKTHYVDPLLNIFRSSIIVHII